MFSEIRLQNSQNALPLSVTEGSTTVKKTIVKGKTAEKNVSQLEIERMTIDADITKLVS